MKMGIATRAKIQPKKLAPALAIGLNGRNATNCCRSIFELYGRRQAEQSGICKRRGKFSGALVVQVAIENPRRKGTCGYNSFEIIIANGGRISFEEYRGKGGRNNDLQWDIDRGYVRVERN
jgi:hypothetical protein